MKPEAARALPPQDDQVMSQATSSSSSDSDARLRNQEGEQGSESGQNGDRIARPYGDHTGKIAKLSV
jgi:hypothetical protein